MLTRLLDLLFPRRSRLGSEGAWITEEERKRLRLFPIRLQKTLLRNKGIRSLDLLVAAGSEQASPLLKKAIRTFKYGRIPELGPELARHLTAALPGLLTPSSKDAPVLCAVPLHWSRQFHRGFNQAKILAEEIGKHQRFEVRDLLQRTRPTGHQAHRKRDERLTALIGAFRAIADGKPMPACVLLVDDICTTGATLDACAAALKQAGVRDVIGLVLAYG